VGEGDIREGVRRLGEVVFEQVRLYGTLTGARAGRTKPAPQQPPTAQPQQELARVVPLPRKHAG
jgi:2-aminoadipate transaminase